LHKLIKNNKVLVKGKNVKLGKCSGCKDEMTAARTLKKRIRVAANDNFIGARLLVYIN
jgi:hypothetical protein